MSSAINRRFLQAFGHVARDDPLRQAFDDRGLADARLADQARGCSWCGGERPGSRAGSRSRARSPGPSCPAGPARPGRGRISRAPGTCRRGSDRLPAGLRAPSAEPEGPPSRDPYGVEKLLGPALDLRERQQQVLDRDVLVFHPLAWPGGLKDPGELGSESRLPRSPWEELRDHPRRPSGSGTG